MSLHLTRRQYAEMFGPIFPMKQILVLLACGGCVYAGEIDESALAKPMVLPLEQTPPPPPAILRALNISNGVYVRTSNEDRFYLFGEPAMVWSIKKRFLNAEVPMVPAPRFDAPGEGYRIMSGERRR